MLSFVLFFLLLLPFSSSSFFFFLAFCVCVCVLDLVCVCVVLIGLLVCCFNCVCGSPTISSIFFFLSLSLSFSLKRFFFKTIPCLFSILSLSSRYCCLFVCLPFCCICVLFCSGNRGVVLFFEAPLLCVLRQWVFAAERVFVAFVVGQLEQFHCKLIR